MAERRLGGGARQGRADPGRRDRRPGAALRRAGLARARRARRPRPRSPLVPGRRRPGRAGRPAALPPPPRAGSRPCPLTPSPRPPASPTCAPTARRTWSTSPARPSPRAGPPRPAGCCCRPAAVAALRDGVVPKGDALGVARVAGIQAVKRTPELIPLAHPVAVHAVEVDLVVVDDGVEITRRRAHRRPHRHRDGGADRRRRRRPRAHRHGQGRRQARPHHRRAGHREVRWPLAATGRRGRERPRTPDGRTARRPHRRRGHLLDPRRGTGVYPDRGGALLVETLRGWGCRRCPTPPSSPTDRPSAEAIAAALATGARPRCSRPAAPGSRPPTARPEATRPLLDREVPGLAEAIRARGVANGIPTAVLSRGVAGLAGRTLVVNLPGSTGGVRDALDGAGRGVAARAEPGRTAATTDVGAGAPSARRARAGAVGVGPGGRGGRGRCGSTGAHPDRRRRRCCGR